MAEIVLYILVSIACILALIGVLYQVIIQRRKKNEANYFSDQMKFAVDQTTREMQKFFDILQMKPSTKGSFGESIVEMLLSHLPSSFVKKQYQPHDISGRIDFTIQLPQSDLIIPIDSKFILPKEFEKQDIQSLNKIAIDGLNKKTIRRAREITKYASSAETSDFVLMFIPDFVYGVLDEKSFQELAELKVVPTNSSGLLSTIFMINMQHRFTKLNSAASRFGDLQVKVCQCVSDVIDRMTKGSTQLQHCFNNLSDAMNDLKKLNATLEALSFDEVDNTKTNFR